MEGGVTYVLGAGEVGISTVTGNNNSCSLPTPPSFKRCKLAYYVLSEIFDTKDNVSKANCPRNSKTGTEILVN